MHRHIEMEVQFVRGPRGVDLGEHWGWLMGLGGAMILAGLGAMIVPGVSAVAVELVIGALFVVEGLLEAYHAFRWRNWSGAALRGLGAALALTAGGLLLTHPVAGVLGLTLLVGGFFVAASVVKLTLAWQLEALPGRGWLAFHGLLSGVLGTMILAGWPWAAPQVLGLLVGIDLLFNGWWLVSLAWLARRAHQAAEARDESSE